MNQLKSQLDSSRNTTSFSAESAYLSPKASPAASLPQQSEQLVLPSFLACNGLVSHQPHAECSPPSSLHACQQQSNAVRQPLSECAGGPQSLASNNGEIHLPLLSAASFAQPALEYESHGKHSQHPAGQLLECSTQALPILLCTNTTSAGLGSHKTATSFMQYPASAGYAEAALRQMRAESVLSSQRTGSFMSGSLPSSCLSGGMHPSPAELSAGLASQQPSSINGADCNVTEHSHEPVGLDAGNVGCESTGMHGSWTQIDKSQALPHLGHCLPAADLAESVHGDGSEAQPECSPAAEGSVEAAFNMLRPPSFPFGNQFSSLDYS